MNVTLALATLTLLLSTPARAEDPPLRKHWFVTGQVQGVGFRAHTHQAATELKLKGWVRNLTDGRVEIVADGDEKQVAALLKRVRKGPPFSRVDAVKDARVDLTEKLADAFEIRDSAAPPPGE